MKDILTAPFMVEMVRTLSFFNYVWGQPAPALAAVSVA